MSKKICCERTDFTEIELLTGQCEYEACCVFEDCPCPLAEKVDIEKMIVCVTCLRAIESREGSIEHKKTEIPEETATCEWCKEELESSELYEI
jgi:hypothetical protein